MKEPLGWFWCLIRYWNLFSSWDSAFRYNFGFPVHSSWSMCGTFFVEVQFFWKDIPSNGQFLLKDRKNRLRIYCFLNVWCVAQFTGLIPFWINFCQMIILRNLWTHSFRISLSICRFQIIICSWIGIFCCLRMLFPSAVWGGIFWKSFIINAFIIFSQMLPCVVRIPNINEILIGVGAFYCWVSFPQVISLLMSFCLSFLLSQFLFCSL